jgi:predicted transposase YbfD/YdcC
MEQTILEALNTVPDYRKGNGIRHVLSDILMIGLLTIICNGDDYAAMRAFGKMHEGFLKDFLQLPNGIPSQDTFERVFQNVNPKYLAVTFKTWVDDLKEAIRRSGSGMVVSIDGKTIRGSKRANKKAIHVVTAFASELRLSLAEIITSEKSNEITAIPELLEMFCTKGMIITIDALGTQTGIAKKIIEKKADYVLAVKGNQQTLHTDIRLLMEHEVIPLRKDELREAGRYENTIEKGHGRIETRECYICTKTHWLTAPSEWVGLIGYALIITKREELGKEPSYSHRYYIFSVKNATAAEILRIVRSHWSIENNLHWMLDVVFKEDDSRATEGHSAENLNIMRKAALQLMKQETSMKASMRGKRLACAWSLEYMLKVIGVN